MISSPNTSRQPIPFKAGSGTVSSGDSGIKIVRTETGRGLPPKPDSIASSGYKAFFSPDYNMVGITVYVIVVVFLVT